MVRILEERESILENRHTGISTMRREMRRLGLPDPVIETGRGSFKVTFFKNKEQNIIEIDTVNDTVRLSNTKKEILTLLEENREITIDKITDKLDKGRRTITRNIKTLKDLNKIKRIGTDKTGYW